jgi:hypothetical protein
MARKREVPAESPEKKIAARAMRRSWSLHCAFPAPPASIGYGHCASCKSGPAISPAAGPDCYCIGAISTRQWRREIRPLLSRTKWRQSGARCGGAPAMSARAKMQFKKPDAPVDKDENSPRRQEVPRAPHSTCALFNNSLSESRPTIAPCIPGVWRFSPGRPPGKNLTHLRHEDRNLATCCSKRR